MKKIVSFLVLLTIGLFSYEANADKDNGKPDDIQKQYISRLQIINYELYNLNYDRKQYDIKNEFQQKNEELELRYRGQIPSALMIKGNEIEKERLRIESRKSELGKNRDELKLDALKYYRGKMPKWLDNEWNKEMHEHYNSLKN